MAKTVRTCFCYRVVRFYRVSGRRQIISVGFTRLQAMAHCSRPGSSRAGVWFDGFELMPGYADYVQDPSPDGFDRPVVWADPIGAGDDVPLSDPVIITLPVPVAGASDPALIYARWQPGPAVRGLFGLPAMDVDGDYWD